MGMDAIANGRGQHDEGKGCIRLDMGCLLYTSDAADEERARQRPFGLWLAGDGVHGSCHRPAFRKGRAYGAEGYGKGCRENTDDTDDIHD